MSMALVCSAGSRSCCSFPLGEHTRSASSPSTLPLLSLHRRKDGGARRGAALVVCARKGISSRTRGGENKGKKSDVTTTRPMEEVADSKEDVSISSAAGDLLGTDGVSSELKPMPELPGLTANFWEGSKWDTFGFVVQYLWAFGIVFALIACGIAVATYNEGATDFKETTVYKESVQTQELLEEPDSSSSDVFEVNPTEVAPSLE